MSYRLTRRAERDFVEIAEYISARSPFAAAKLVRRFIRQWEILATQPLSGQSCDELHPGARRLVMGGYIAFYRVQAGDVLILRVLHGRQDITSEDFAG